MGRDVVKVSKASHVASKEAENRLKLFVDKFEPKHQALIRATRKALRNRFPTAHELVYDNYNFFVIGYSPTGRPSDAVLSIVAAANGVGVCFIRGKGLPDPEKLLRGSGNQTRSIHLDDASTLANPAVARLIDEAVARTQAPFASKGKGPLVIKSISAKQRPRRRTT